LDYQDINFKRAVGILLVQEGGYVNDPDDPGGETNFGITKRTYPQLDIKNLTINKAIDIYYNDFWLKYKLNTLSSPIISTQLLLLFVNLSPSSAATCVQKAINRITNPISEDGIFGSQTIDMLNKLPECHVSDHIKLELVKFYLNRVSINRKQLKNLEGWVKRAML
jgi:lysozyme family protein